jgi:hydrophobic/amphiphilic exporter-1 (mainly G- bacteria), HAE1 family
MILTKISIKNPVFTVMIMLALVVMGALSLSRMGIDEFPNVTFPVVVVQTEYPGASPESVESDVTRKLEESINSVAGLKDISSRSYQGLSVIIAEFNLTEDLNRVTNDVRDKVNAIKPFLKDDVKDPIISKFDPADTPIISYAVSNPNMNFKELSTLVDQKLKRRIETIRGVGQVNIIGSTKRELQIQLNPDKLRAYNIGIDQFIQRLRSENLELPAGFVGGYADNKFEKNLQIQGKLKDINDFNKIVIGVDNGNVVYLNQVASIQDTEAELSNVALYNGKRAIAIDVLKAKNENTIAVAQNLQKRIVDIQAELPQGTSIQLIRDSSQPITKNVKNVQATILEGAALTIAIVFLFLNSWRSTIITGLTLPISIISTFAFMYLLGFTINVITLMALSISVGLLIDDAIVVRENIMRHIYMGKDHIQASLDGTKEIGLAVLATTFSIVAVFLPVGLMGGIIGQFFYQFGITVVVAVLISMFVSFTLDPMLSAVWKDPVKNAEDIHKFNLIQHFALWFEHQMDRLGNVYQRCLAFSLKRRWLTMLGALAIFISSFFIAPLLGFEFVPQPDFGETTITLNTPAGSSLQHTQNKVLEAEHVLTKRKEVVYTYSTINTGNAQGKNYASIYVKLVPKKQRTLSQPQIENLIRQDLNQVAGISINNVGPINKFGGKPILISLRGQNLDELERISTEAIHKLQSIEGLVDIKSSLKERNPIVSVQIKREQAADLGISLPQINNVIRPLFNGENLSTWRYQDEEYDVKLKLNPQLRNIETLENIPLSYTQSQSQSLNTQAAAPKNASKLIDLKQVAEVKNGFGASQINRKNLTREVFIDANAFGRSTGVIGVDIQTALSSIKLPAGYEFVTGGANKDMAESGKYAIQALILAVIFIYMVLASQFGSFMQPIAIMASLPMTLIGVLLALLVFRSTMNLFSVIGFIMLMGLVTKNAILLIDYANHLREQGYERNNALLDAAKVRLRPILMTTLAMIFGMLPLALGLSEGSEQRSSLGQSVIGGVITSSLLTLVVVPVVYTLLEDLYKIIAKKLKRKHKDNITKHV